MINEEKLDEVLLTLGYDDFNRGTTYLRECVKEYTPGDKITALYARVGRLHGTTGSRVERAIRHVQRKAWGRCPMLTRVLYFGNSVDPDTGPTNCELIARLERICHQD